MSFDLLGLSEPLLRAVADSGYSEPTPIQRQAIPSVLQGRDILGIAQTGTGKTAGFTLPMIDILAEGRSKARMPRSLILEPTRELAAQVAESFERYGKYHKLTMALLIGGVAFGDQDKALAKGVDVLIATPGRLIDQFERSRVMLSGVEILVVDEADRMLDMGFIPDVEKICSLMPAKRQTLFFSATMPPPVKRLVDRFLNDPKVIEVARPATANVSISQKLMRVPMSQKRDVLKTLLRAEGMSTAIVFCNRKSNVRELYDVLKRADFSVAQLHGDMEQSERIAELDRFRGGSAAILVASDVAARGLDIPGVSHVFNFDVPYHPDDYVHRIGRTGRAGRTGIAISLATDAEMESVEAIEKLTQMSIERVDAPSGGSRRTATSAAAAGDEGGEARRPARRRRSGKSESAAPAAEAVAPAPQEPEVEPAPQPVAASRPDRGGRRTRGERATRPERTDRPDRQRREREEPDVPVVGLGDHVPAFLMSRIGH